MGVYASTYGKKYFSIFFDDEKDRFRVKKCSDYENIEENYWKPKRENLKNLFQQATHLTKQHFNTLILACGSLNKEEIKGAWESEH